MNGANGRFYYGGAIVAALGIVTIVAYGTTQEELQRTALRSSFELRQPQSRMRRD